MQESKNSKIWDVVVVGGGPAGMMAAGRAAELGSSVLLLEKNDTLGKKLLITGGGRCNVTNAEFDTRTFLAKFKSNKSVLASEPSDQFLFSAFAQHGVPESLDFFHSHEMPTKVEALKRTFPESNKAESVWNVLVDQMKATGVTVQSNAEVKKFNCTKKSNNENEMSVASEKKSITSVTLKNGTEIFAKKFILATGGKSRPETGSTGDGFAWLKEMGHTVVESDAALVPLIIKNAWVKKLAGVSLADVKITVLQNEVKQLVKKGKMLFTHVGVSGPTILNMSKDIGELLKYGEVLISLDLFPAHDFSTLNTALQELFKNEHRKKFKNSLHEFFATANSTRIEKNKAAPTPVPVPAALIPMVVTQSGIDPEKACNSITREERITLMKLLKDMRMEVKGLLGVEKAIITSGGVSLSEIDFKTMRSRVTENLFIIGDLLNIDRPSGGYSLQLCWTTGYVAGTHASKISENKK